MNKPAPLTPFQRLWRNVDATSSPNGCWIWTGIVNSWGYGAFHADGKRMVAVHRWLYQQFLGRKLGRWEFCLHTCDTPRCVNPAHLYVGTPKDNVRDMYVRGRDRNRGEKNFKALLTEAMVLEIRRDYRLERKGWKKSNLDELYERYKHTGVTRGAIYQAAIGHSWKHLNDRAPASTTTSHMERL